MEPPCIDQVIQFRSFVSRLFFQRFSFGGGWDVGMCGRWGHVVNINLLKMHQHFPIFDMICFFHVFFCWGISFFSNFFLWASPPQTTAYPGVWGDPSGSPQAEPCFFIKIRAFSSQEETLPGFVRFVDKSPCCLNLQAILLLKVTLERLTCQYGMVSLFLLPERRGFAVQSQTRPASHREEERTRRSEQAKGADGQVLTPHSAHMCGSRAVVSDRVCALIWILPPSP